MGLVDGLESGGFDSVDCFTGEDCKDGSTFDFLNQEDREKTVEGEMEGLFLTVEFRGVFSRRFSRLFSLPTLVGVVVGIHALVHFGKIPLVDSSISYFCIFNKGK